MTTTSNPYAELIEDRADWLLDAIAAATQDRRFLRGDPEYDEVAGEAILLNGAKAIRTAISQLTRDVEEAIKAFEPLVHAAEGLSFGIDWNNGTQAKTHGHRRKLLKAIPKARATLTRLSRKEQ